MSFLDEMARTSAARAAAAAPVSELRARIANRETAPILHLEGFDLIAEVKRKAPSVGALDLSVDPATQAAAYARAGAAAISVLTEPERFGGSLEDLTEVVRAVDVPVMRKDFLVDPVQILEAAAYGAGGVLLIIRMLDEARLEEMIHAAREYDLFVLLEAFDEADLARAPAETELLGLNCRDLGTLQVDPSRFPLLASAFPEGCVPVAESGLDDEEDAAAVAALGYEVALVGSALMRAEDPEAQAAAMIAAGREMRAEDQPSPARPDQCAV